MTENILIFGSRFPFKIPNIEATEIFSSNGSAELVSIYKEKIMKVKHSCVVGARSFTKLEHIKTRVINSNPDRLIIRDYEDVYCDIKSLFKNNLEILKFTKKEQFLFQKKFFNNGFYDLVKSEFKYENNFIGKISHIFFSIIRGGFIGVSSGFFALLYASQKYPNSNLIISGLGFEGGKHFYGSGKMTSNRGMVDNYLIKVLKKDIKERILSVDEDIAKKLNIKLYKQKILSI